LIFKEKVIDSKLEQKEIQYADSIRKNFNIHL